MNQPTKKIFIDKLKKIRKHLDVLTDMQDVFLSDYIKDLDEMYIKTTTIITKLEWELELDEQYESCKKENNR